MSQEEITQAYAALAETTTTPPTVKQVIEEVENVIHESISDLVEYSIPDVFVTSQYRKSTYVVAGHERWQVRIVFRWGLDGDEMSTIQTFYSECDSLAACITAIHHQIAEFASAIKIGVA